MNAIREILRRFSQIYRRAGNASKCKMRAKRGFL
jgi:hypothetical protein